MDFLCNEQFRFMQQARNRAAFVDEFQNRLADGFVVAAENRRAARLQKVDITVAVSVGQVSAVRFGNTDGERLIEREIVLHAAGDVLLGFFVYRAGLFALLVEIAQHFALVIIARDFVNRFAREFFQARVDLARVVPAADTAVVHGFILQFSEILYFL